MDTSAAQDRKFMAMALRLARKGLGRTSPNPVVGAVVVKNNRVVGKGYHQRAGGPHAEVYALKEAGDQAKGATLYVTLEPCNHFGRTPPCTLAIQESGIARVVYGMNDPNPQVKGGGGEWLRAQGLEVVKGVLEEECRRLNEVYIKWIATGLPFVILKAAISLDGRIATRTGDSQWISGETSRLLVHRLRNQVDAVLVGIGTVLKDDPRLTVRLPGEKKTKDPLRVVIDPRLRLPQKARLLSDPGRVVVATRDPYPSRKGEALKKLGVDLLLLREEKGRLSLRSLLAHLGRRGVTSLLVEGGAETFAGFLEERMVDKILVFIAPCLIGGKKAPGMIGGKGAARIAEALRLKEMRVRTLGEDIFVEAYPEK
jgi:diaminohydroxyphosphoribosylaminopyrimidine deaminase/5-amino-6-(5-phosphoribosylamino)uracil reductase